VKVGLIARNIVWMAALLLFAAACGGGEEPAGLQGGEGQGGDVMQIVLSSPAFEPEGAIPRKFTCDGEDISPPLEWEGVPNDAESLALILDDPDAPRGTWVHWVVYNLEPGLTGLPEGAVARADGRPMGVQGRNDFRRNNYGGPCPPSGPAHRYFFKLYALDTVLDLEAGATKAELEAAMQGHTLAQGQLMGTYGR